MRTASSPATHRSLRGLTSLVAAVAFLVGCGGGNSTYFPSPDESTSTLPAQPGDIVYFGVADVRANPGDKVTLLAANLVDASASVETKALAMPRGQGGIGLIRKADLPPDFDLTKAEPLGSFAVKPDSLAQILLEIHPSSPGRLTAKAVDVRFRVGDAGEQTERFPAALVLCVNDPLPVSCD
jgi:hypothetical protein